MSITSTRAAIAAALTANTSLTVYDTVVGNPVPPCAVVGWPESFNPHAAFGDNADYVIPVILMVSFQTNDADGALMAYLDKSGGWSVIDIIETANNAWHIPTVHDVGPMVISDAGNKALACIIDVHVMA